MSRHCNQESGLAILCPPPPPPPQMARRRHRRRLASLSVGQLFAQARG